MGRFNWGREAPPDDAYSRVTEPERFNPLHCCALGAVARLQSEYELTLDEDGTTDADLERSPLSKPLIKLAPIQDSSAPAIIAFTGFPGLGLRAGRGVTDWFPFCGCDACDEMLEEEFERFTEFLTDVVAGRFRESLYLDPVGAGWSSRELWGDEHRHRSGGSRVPATKRFKFLTARHKLFWSGRPGNQERTVRPLFRPAVRRTRPSSSRNSRYE